MTASVDFNDETCLMTEKIHDIPPHSPLPGKLYRIPPEKSIPELFLLFRHGIPKLLRQGPVLFLSRKETKHPRRIHCVRHGFSSSASLFFSIISCKKMGKQEEPPHSPHLSDVYMVRLEMIHRFQIVEHHPSATGRVQALRPPRSKTARATSLAATLFERGALRAHSFVVIM